MPPESEQQVNAQEQQQQEGQEHQQEQKTYTQAEWDARQRDFDSKANKIRRNAAREAELRLRRELDGQRGQQQQGQQQQQQQADPEPKREEFEDYEAYMRALGKWEGRQAARDEFKKNREEESRRTAAEAKTEAERAFRKHAEAVMDDIPDFAEVIESAEDVMISAAMGDAITEAGAVGPRILYYLVQNPAEADRIASLKSAAAQVREIGKLEAKIEAELALKKKDDKDESQQEGDEQDQEQRSEQRDEQQGTRGDDGRFKAQEKGTRKAPEPIEPGTGRSANQDRGPNDKDSDATWYQKRLAQERAERQRQRGK